jgi:hypothetical protein
MTGVIVGRYFSTYGFFIRYLVRSPSAQRMFVPGCYRCSIISMAYEPAV